MERFNFSKRDFLFFLVDDDAIYTDALEHNLTSFNPNYTIKKFATAKDCLKNLNQSPDFVILDYNLETEKNDIDIPDGGELLKRIKSIDETIMVIMLSGQDDLKIALDSIKHGAIDYIIKNDTAFLRLRNIIKKTIDEGITRSQLKNYKKILAYIILVLMLITAVAFILTFGWPEKFDRKL